MSVQSAIRRKTAPDIRARKNGEPIVMLTSYHAHTAALVDRYCDVILVVAAYIRGRIYTTLKHPMLSGVKLWAAAHLIANGDLGGIILFGAFLGWAVFDRISLKRRADAGAPPIPVGGLMNDLIAVAVGIVAYLALAFAFHPVVIGIPVVGV